MNNKKIFLLMASFAIMVLVATGCGSTSTSSSANLNEMDFFNKYVEELNKTSKAVRDMHNVYESSVPLEVKVEDEITLSLDSQETAKNQFSSSKAALIESNLKIDNGEKQTVLENLFKDYYAKYEAYNTAYTDIGGFYNNATYKTDIAKATENETTIQDLYAEVKTAQETLFDKLDEYQKTSASKADINSSDPIEKINASIDLLTNDVESIYTAYMDEWDVKSEPTAVNEKYLTLIANRALAVSGVNGLEASSTNVVPVKDYFINNYIVSLDAYSAYVKTLLDDYAAGTVSTDNIADYDLNIQNAYDQVINDHNEIINLSEKALENTAQ